MNKIVWKFVSNNGGIEDIINIENNLNIKLPKDYIECVIVNNGGYPDRFTYDTDEEKGKVFEYLLGISEKDDDNIIDTYSMIKDDLNNNIIPFARDGFGNYICFEYIIKDKYKVVFYNHENQDIQFICSNFSEFINKLY